MTKKTHDQYIQRVKEKRGDSVEVLGEYVNSKTKIFHNFKSCPCPKILITPQKILIGRGCGHCRAKRSGEKQKIVHNDYLSWLFENRFYEVFPLEKCILSHFKIKHLWLECGHTTFITPSKIKMGRGCEVCAGRYYSHDDYLNWIFENRPWELFPLERWKKDNIKIRHLWFECGHITYAVPNKIKIKIISCTKCANYISKISQKWINKKEQEIGRKLIREYKFNPNGFHRADGYDKKTNTIYEFYGDYFHGNPNNKNYKNYEFCKKAYRNTLIREKLIKDLGYNLITIWESDFRKNINKIKNT